MKKGQDWNAENTVKRTKKDSGRLLMDAMGDIDERYKIGRAHV